MSNTYEGNVNDVQRLSDKVSATIQSCMLYSMQKKRNTPKQERDRFYYFEMKTFCRADSTN